MFISGQTAGWMNMVLGMEIGLSPDDFMLDGDPATLPQKGAEPPPQFYRQTDRTGQRSDSMGRTVLQTVAQKT